jgi:hypothetical protein
VEPHRAQNGLAQCHNCQKFGHVWTNCKQPPRYLCGGGHLPKRCPQKRNISSTPSSNMPQLSVGGRRRPHPANYRSCRHAKEDMQKKKSQRTPGRVFSSNITTADESFAAAHRGETEEQKEPQAHHVAVEGPVRMEPRFPAALPHTVCL